MSRPSERTDLGFTRDRHSMMRKSGKPDLRARAKSQDPGDTTGRTSGPILRFAILALGPRKPGLSGLRAFQMPISGEPEVGVSFRSRKSARFTRPGHEDRVSRTSERQRAKIRDPGATR